MSGLSTTHPSVSSELAGASTALSLFQRTLSSKGLAGMLLAASVSALIVVADSVVDSYAQGHLLLGWVCTWAVGFAAMGLLAGTARRSALQLARYVGNSKARRAQRRSDAYLLALARHDPRIMTEVREAVQRAQLTIHTIDPERVQAWVDRHPLGTFNASYQGRRNGFHATPLSGLPTHLQYLPG